MSRAGILQRNNTSGVPGIRPRWRTPRHGRPQLGLDVRYIGDDGRQHFTTLPATLDGMRRALALREATVGCVIPGSSCGLLRQMKAAAGTRPAATGGRH